MDVISVLVPDGRLLAILAESLLTLLASVKVLRQPKIVPRPPVSLSDEIERRNTLF